MDLTRLDRIASALPPDDAAWLRERLEPTWRQRARALDARDDAVRMALALLDGTPNPPARLVAQMALQAREKRPERLTGNHLLVEAVGAILRHNGGGAD